MTILFTGRKAHLTPELKSLIETKLSKLNRVLGDILDVHAILKREKHRHVTEIVVKSRFATLTATAVGPEFNDSVGVCVERLLSQAKKHSGRLKTRRRGRGAWKAPRRGVPDATDREESETIGEPQPPVVRMGRVPVRAMSIQEALLKVRDDSRPFVVFRNADTKVVGLLFRRPDGQFGMYEMKG